VLCCSKTNRTERSRNSTGYRFGFPMPPSSLEMGPPKIPGRFIWASSCAPCIKAFPTLRALAPELAKLAPIDLVMVSLDRSALAAMNASRPAIESAQYLVMEGKEWDHDIVKAFRITSIPHTLMVLPDGRSYPVDLQNSRWVECVKAVLSHSDAR
jgi:thiol-disulfide isomerase/thioredoxin